MGDSQKHYVGEVSEHVLVFNEGNQLLILQNNKQHESAGKWLFPGGRLNETDQELSGLQREIREETGLEQVKILMPFHVMFWGQKSHRYGSFYLGMIDGTPTPTLSSEHIAFAWVQPEEALKYEFIDIRFLDIINTGAVLIDRLVKIAQAPALPPQTS